MALGGFFLGAKAALASYVYTSIATLIVLPILLAFRK